MITYAKIEDGDSTGFTNRIISFIYSIISGIKRKCKVVVFDNYINDPSNNLTVPISQIIDIVELNRFLLHKYNIVVVDKKYVKLKSLRVLYGTERNVIDITDGIQSRCLMDGRLFICKYIDFNRIRGDPDLGKKKQVRIEYELEMDLVVKSAKYNIEETYDEILEEDIIFDTSNAKYVFKVDDLTVIILFPGYQIFEDILTKIEYLPIFQINASNTIKRMDMNRKVNVIHLRIENDAIEFWSKSNKMDQIEFKKTIENKYIQLIQKYLNKVDYTVVLSESVLNNVVNFLMENNYNVVIPEKFYTSKHLNAIVDMLVSRACNNIFIGGIHLYKLNGSTFSYYCQRMMNDSVKRIVFNPDNITEPEAEYESLQSTLHMQSEFRNIYSINNHKGYNY